MNALIHWLSQVAAVTQFSLTTIPQRRGSSLAAIFGIAGVVAVLVGVLSIAQGFRQVMRSSGARDTVIVMRSGADSEMTSILMQEDTRVVADAPGVARTPEGALASAELFIIIDLPKRSTGTDANVPLRGVENASFLVRHNLKIVEGRRFEPGRNEVVVGVGAAGQFAGLDVGSRLKVGQNEWTVVGHFSAEGSIAESEIWTDARVLQAAYRRGTSYQSVYARLTEPAPERSSSQLAGEGGAQDSVFQRFKDSLTSDPRVKVKVVLLDEYYEEQSQMISNLITGLGVLIATMMAVGAVFGALNTMYTAVAVRSREIATLRALGFGSGPVVVSVMIESLLFAAVGGILGGGAAYWAFNGYQASTLNWQSFSQVAFAFLVTPQLLFQGVIYAAAIGFLGGLFPAIRSARLPVARALREL
jgi:putative ABC transport system permease protein